MTSWQPIEMAPKDGTLVDLWVVWGPGEGRGERIANARWLETRIYKPSWTFYDTYHGEEDVPLEDGAVIAWMPIPEGP